MLEPARLKLRRFRKEPFSFLERLDCLERDYQYELVIIENTGRVLHFAIEDNEDIIEIVDKVSKEEFVTTIIVTDYKRKIHYWKNFERK